MAALAICWLQSPAKSRYFLARAFSGTMPEPTSLVTNTHVLSAFCACTASIRDDIISLAPADNCSIEYACVCSLQR